MTFKKSWMIKIFLNFGINTLFKNPLNDLNPDKKFDEKKASNKRVTTHRIVNLKTLTEVFSK